jgi:hypothetical protein
LRGGIDDKQMGFKEVARRRRAMKDNDGAGGQGGGDGEPAKMLFCTVVGVLLHTWDLKKKQHMRRNH